MAARRLFSTATTKAKKEVDTVEFCKDIVYRGDKNGYLCGLLLPSSSQRSYFAIRAFNIETARIREAVNSSETSMGLRFQFWRDVIDYAYTGTKSISHPESHPLTTELRYAVAKHGLTRRWFDRIIDAREDDAPMQFHETMAEMEDYAEKTASSMLYLTLEALNVRNSDADHAASHAGKAIGISTMLYGLPYLFVNGQLRIPKDVMTEHNLTTRSFTALASVALGNEDKKKEEQKQDTLSKEEKAFHFHVPPEQPSATKRSINLTPRTIDAMFGGHGSDLKEKKLKPVDRSKEIEEAHSAMIDSIFHTASVAHGHLEHAREMQSKIPKQGIPAFFTTTPAKLFLKRLERTSYFDIFDPKLRNDPIGQLRLQGYLLRNKVTKSF